MPLHLNNYWVTFQLKQLKFWLPVSAKASNFIITGKCYYDESAFHLYCERAHSQCLVRIGNHKNKCIGQKIINLIAFVMISMDGFGDLRLAKVREFEQHIVI